MSNDNIDKGLETLQSKLGAHEFEFDDQMWEKMEVKLDEEAGLLATWGGKLAALLSIAAVRWSVVLLLISGSVYFFAPMIVSSNEPSESKTPMLSTKTKNKESKISDTSSPSMKEVITSTESVLYPKAIKNTTTPKGKNKVNLKDNQNNTTHSKTNKHAITETTEADLITNKTTAASAPENSTAKKEEIPSNKQALLPYSQNSSSTGALIIEEIPSKTITSIPPFSKFHQMPIPMPISFKKNKLHWGITAGVLAKRSSLFSGNAYFGITANRKIKSNWKMGFALTYKRFRLPSLIEFSYADSTTNSYGATLGTYLRKREIKSIETIEASINVQYTIPHSRSTFKLGIRPSYAITSRGTSSISEFGNYSRERAELIHSTFFQNFSGLRRLSVGITLGYEFKLSSRLNLDLNYTQGFVDQSIDEFFKNNTKHRNTDLQLGFIYQIK